ncbi:MAG TPA: MarR family winged helix-turn-helix transcriptional regulator [Allosphingosinicella sp.]|nr:MarR family winged helix-turn-helix transcriptional regulator [Allosphingosinicella sp.]
MLPQIGPMDHDPDVLDVLRSYPQIYLACHVEHRTRASSPTGLTARDGTLLAHVEDPPGSSPAMLARHLGVARSTLSAALARLESQGMLRLEGDPADARRRLVRLTAEGRAAVARDSVLDPARVAALLALMPAAERRSAVAGLKLLAAAARRHQEGEEPCGNG